MKSFVNKSKRLSTMLYATALVLGVSVTAQQALAGIKDTKHNLGANVGGTNNYTSDASVNGEVCVFCHTPHGSDASAAAPLWNKALPTGTTYTTYAQTGTIDSALGKPGAISLACLSCHDGAQAMDNLINAPGSGGYTAGGGGANGRAYAWTGYAQNTVDADGKMRDGGTAIPAVGASSDLSNDHPIGIQYCGGPTGATVNGTCKDSDFVSYTAGSGSMTNGPWWVDTTGGTNNVRNKTDMILYASGGASRDQGIGPQVECATCHDPHTSNTALFLRMSGGNQNSQICLACHIK